MVVLNEHMERVYFDHIVMSTSRCPTRRDPSTLLDRVVATVVSREDIRVSKNRIYHVRRGNVGRNIFDPTAEDKSSCLAVMSPFPCFSCRSGRLLYEEDPVKSGMTGF